MKTGTWIGLGILAAAGIGAVVIAKKSFSASTIPTAKNPASENSPDNAYAAGASVANHFFDWLTGSGNNTGSTNSTGTTPADTAKAYSSPLDFLF